MSKFIRKEKSSCHRTLFVSHSLFTLTVLNLANLYDTGFFPESDGLYEDESEEAFGKACILFVLYRITYLFYHSHYVQ